MMCACSLIFLLNGFEDMNNEFEDMNVRNLIRVRVVKRQLL